MRNIFKNISILTLSLVVLISSMGVTVFKMVCCKKNKTEVSLGEFKCCKHKQKSGTNFTKKCCDYSSTTLKVEQLYKDNSFCLLLSPLQQSKINQQLLFNFSAFQKHFACNSSPPLSRKQILISISSFLI